MADSNFIVDLSRLELTKKLSDEAIKKRLLVYANASAPIFEGYAKQNRPWTDRTGDARKRLKCTAKAIDEGVEISLSHGVDYGLWLELAHEQNYAILKPTIEIKAPEFVEGLKNLFQ